MLKQVFFLIVSAFFITAKAQNLHLLFSPPTSAEINNVINDWNNRDTQAYNWQIVGSGLLSGLVVDVVSHDVNDSTHYGFVIHPENYNPNLKYPIHIKNHGGTNGVTLHNISGCYRDYFNVIPSYRGETLRTGSLGLGDFVSQGSTPIIELDNDVDDALALLNGVIDNYSGADTSRILVSGCSRGAGVSYLMSIREPRIKKAVYFYGSTDHITFPHLEDSINEIMNTGINKGPFYNLVMKAAVTNYMSGTMPLNEARLALLRRSAVYFINYLPDNMQIHHGDMDQSVPVYHSQLLDSLLVSNNLPIGYYEYFEYLGGGHGNNMPLSQARKDSFLCEPFYGSVLPSLKKITNLFKIYPTLVENDINIEFDLNFDGVIQVQLISILGQLEKTLTNNKYFKGTHYLNIDINSIPSGIYFVQMIYENRVINVSRIVKL